MLTPPLTDIPYLKQLLAKAGVSPKRSMGQNFLVCPEVVEATLAALEDGPEQVTELGAGAGSLTQGAISAGYAIRAIEKDDVLVKILSQHVGTQAEVIHGDIKEVDWAWKQPYQLIGNIPYNISGLIIRRLTQLDPAPAQAVFLMQTEVAQRLLATPPNMSLLSLAVQLWGEAHHILTVPPSCFWPQPKVSSALVALQPHRAEQVQGTKPEREIREDTMQLAKTCFQNKRKQIAGSLKRAHYLPTAVSTALKKVGVSPSARPQELSPANWRNLRQELSSNS